MKFVIFFVILKTFNLISANEMNQCKTCNEIVKILKEFTEGMSTPEEIKAEINKLQKSLETFPIFDFSYISKNYIGMFSEFIGPVGLDDFCVFKGICSTSTKLSSSPKNTDLKAAEAYLENKSDVIRFKKHEKCPILE